MIALICPGMDVYDDSRSADAKRVNRMRRNGLVESKDFSTEDTENHGDARRFFRSKPGASRQFPDPSNRFIESKTADVTARTVSDSESPCPPVVLHPLRAEFFLCQTGIPPVNLTHPEIGARAPSDQSRNVSTFFPPPPARLEQPNHGGRP
jgi:hypothetical protein